MVYQKSFMICAISTFPFKSFLKKRFLAAAVLLLASFPLFARDIEILVEDADLELPLEGAVIRSYDGRQYICDESGKAIVSVPDDRQVVIQASCPGYENGRLIIAVGTDKYVLSLRLSGIMEGSELIIEAARPGSNETKTGRSVAVSEREIAQTGEIGIVEDVMSTIKLLPGVGYTGLMNAQPSIRGGDPEDMRASLDGFYVFYPYFSGGAYSVFDPRMVQSAQLTHGVFSSRYGHSVSGLLEITSRNPSPTETEFELGMSTSSANFNLSLPLAGKGGVLLMGRVTYFDPVNALIKQAAKSIEALEQANALRTAPYIRSGIITGNYRFSHDLELHATGLWGMDGIGILFENSSEEEEYSSNSIFNLDWNNYQGFFTSGLSWNPRTDKLLKFTAGLGFRTAEMNSTNHDVVLGRAFTKTPENAWYYDTLSSRFGSPYNVDTFRVTKNTENIFNTQGRLDYDWHLGRGFLVSVGIQEMFIKTTMESEQLGFSEKPLSGLSQGEQETIFAYFNLGPSDPLRDYLKESLMIRFPVNSNNNAENNLLISSGYSLAEYRTPDNRLGIEFGLRIDHYYLSGNGIGLSSQPALNPRLNIDFNVFKNSGFIQSLDISAGTGLFSSMSNNIFITEKGNNIDAIKPNRSWTSVLGAGFELSSGFSFNIESYYKYLFDRMYMPIYTGLGSTDTRLRFDGEGRAWGIDFILKKQQSRFLDGWLSYSFNWTKYRDPDGTDKEDWYFPAYHRFHNLNLVLNIKPTPRINIYTRFGLASGAQISKLSGNGPVSYPVLMYDPDNPDSSQFIEKFFWLSELDGQNRATPSLQLDIKFSIYGKENSGKKTRSEVYVALENVLGMLYTSKGNTGFNQYTGEIDTGIMAGSYDIPVPMPSFGFKYSY
ncbi:MAG: TonB-dependent receptor plug domain-containing protein [Treponema sp.]|jgi:hypothetical protein|nr:TonB-dependent receptor plug domain-containing protein [Treponema sp.]